MEFYPSLSSRSHLRHSAWEREDDVNRNTLLPNGGITAQPHSRGGCVVVVQEAVAFGVDKELISGVVGIRGIPTLAFS